MDELAVPLSIWSQVDIPPFNMAGVSVYGLDEVIGGELTPKTHMIGVYSMTLVDGWLWLFMGLIAVGFIILLLRIGMGNKRLKITKSLPNGTKQIREWEYVFSWKPIRTVDKGWVWLRPYWRRQIYTPATVDGVFEESYFYQNVIKIAWYAW
jgi:hypothetical protein